MSNQTKLSVLAAAKEKFVALRKKYGIKIQCTIPDVAQRSGLPVEFLKDLPTTVEGFMDWHPDPRFIAVNGNLPAHDQVWFIARQLAAWAHQQRFNSLALDRPWKWEMLDAAPVELKQKISELDIEYRAHFLMLFFATGDEFRAFIKADKKRLWSKIFTDKIIAYQLSMLRVKLWLGKFRRRIATVAFPSS
jgi:hypothetical protein